MYSEINLTQGKVTLVDSDILHLVLKYKWTYHSGGYAVTSVQVYPNKAGHRPYMLHRFVVDCLGDPLDFFRNSFFMIDHINGDSLDNRRSNLRLATKIGNHQNQKIRSDSKGGLKGIHPHPSGHFTARIQNPNTKLREYLGFFKTAEEAARAYDDAARLYFGEFAALNFPKDNERSAHQQLNKE